MNIISYAYQESIRKPIAATMATLLPPGEKLVYETAWSVVEKHRREGDKGKNHHNTKIMVESMDKVTHRDEKLGVDVIKEWDIIDSADANVGNTRVIPSQWNLVEGMVKMLNSNWSEKFSYIGIITVTILGLYLSSLYSYLLFHSLIEIVTIAISFALFILTWNTRRFLVNGCFNLIGIGYAFIALIDLLHTFAYKGMNVFPGYGANLPTQLWIAARYLQAVTLLAALLFVGRKVNSYAILGMYAIAVSALVAVVYSGNFPDCYIEEKGLTSFKIGSEYVISALFLASLYFFCRKRKCFNDRVFFLIVSSIACTVLAEISFTAYVSVYGFANLVGHFFKLAAFYLVYQAILVTGFQEPFDLIFRDLKQTEGALRKAHDTLEEKIGERTAELQNANELLQHKRALLGRIMETSPVGITVVNQEGQITFANSQAERVLGLTKDEITQRTYNAPDWRITDLSGGPFPDEKLPFRQVMTTQQSVYGVRHAIEWPDGRRVLLSINGAPLLDESGQVESVVFALQDITERIRRAEEAKRAQEALCKSEQELREAQRVGRLGSWDWDAVTDTITWSEEYYHVYGFDPAQRPPGYEEHLKAYTPESAARLDAAVKRNMQTGEPYELDLELAGADSPCRWIMARSETKHDANGQIVGLRGTAQDITERKRVQSIMQARLRLLEFASSHSLDELLTAALDEIEALTGSTIGFYHFLEQDQKTLSLQNWSTNTLKNMCTAEGKGSHYDVAQAGVWVDCIYEHHPVIHNDYASLPHRKGMPEGHAPVVRELVVPIFRGELIMAIIGVGNKAADYDESDVAIVSQLGDLSWDIVERKRAEESLRESENKHRVVADFTYDWEFWLAPDGALEYVSPSCERVTGYTAAEFTAAPHLLLEIVHPNDWAVVAAHLEAKAPSGEPGNIEFRMIARDGSERWIEHACQSVYDPAGRWLGQRGSNRDITERKRAEETLRRMNRELRAISNCNQIMLRAASEQALLNEICRIICDEAGYRMAWVGYAENDAAKTVRPIAWAGVEEGYLANANITWADTERGRGPTGTAIRCGESICIQDFTTDPQVDPWREAALQRGYRSSIALPLKDENAHTFGALNIYSTEPNVFTPDEMRLLGELADDLAFGITTLRTRAERKEAEQRLADSEERLRLTLEATQIGTWEWDVKNDQWYASPTYYSMLGYEPRPGPTDRSEWLERVHPDDRASVQEKIQEALRQDFKAYEYEARRQHADGAYRWQYVQGFGIKRDESGRVARVMGICMDITERKRAEEALRASEERFRDLYENAPNAYFSIGMDGHIRRCNRRAGELLRYDVKELIGRPVLELYADTADGKVKAKQVLQRFQAGETVRDEELQMQRADGSLVWISLTVNAARDAEGRIIESRSMIVDITERKRADEMLQESEKRVRRKLDAILSPETDISALELADIIDSEKIQKLMDEFYQLTHIGIGIIDLHGRVLVGTGWQDICTKFHRVNPRSCQLCIESDFELSRDVPVGTFKQYRCKNNMWDIATPIMLGDRHIGNIFLGQFLFDDEMPDYETFRQQARLYGFNEQEYIAALERVPRWSRKTVEAAMSFYAAFAEMISNLSYGNVKLASALEERKRAEDELLQSEHYKTIQNQLANVFLTIPDEEMYGEVLAVVLQVMESKFGVFGFIEANGALVIPSMTREIWNECLVPDKSIVFPPETWGNSLWGRAIREKRTLYSDGPFHTPEGHVRIEHFLTAPIVFGNEAIGLISVANKERGYTEQDKDLLESVTSYISPILNARLQRDRQEQERQRTEESLRKRNEELERFERAVIGRELKMIELKKRIAELEEKYVSSQ